MLPFSCQFVPALHDPMDCSTPDIPVSHHLLGLAQVHVIESVMPFDNLILCRPLPLLPSTFPTNKSALRIRWPKYWSLASSEYLELISFRIDWFDLELQGTLFSSTAVWKASVLRCSAFFMAQLLQPDMTTGKTVALTMWTFVGKVTSLLFNTLSRFAMTFLQKQPSFNFMATVTIWEILEPREICHCFYVFPFYLPWSDETGCHDLRNETNELTYKTKREGLRERPYCQVEGTVREFGVDKDTLPYVKWITSTVNLAQRYMPAWLAGGLGRIDICVCKAECLHCSLETTTRLFISYTPNTKCSWC